MPASLAPRWPPPNIPVPGTEPVTQAGGKLPDVGTTIFSLMSRRARELGALDIGQGFPDYEVDPLLGRLLGEAVAAGHNQYAPMGGSPALRQAIGDKIAATRGVRVDADTEVTVTLGATEALFSAIQAAVGPGDDAIVFDPAYDSYDPAIRLAGGRCVHIPLAPPMFRYDWERVAAALTPRTRLIIINSPHNPGCTLAQGADLDELARLTRDRGITVLSDEVYEHVVFDGRHHASVLAHPELRQRSFAVFSFGKTLHATGWRVGYCVASAALTRELRKVHQFNTFSIAAPLQEAIARYLAAKPKAWDALSGFFQARRDRLLAGLAGSGIATSAAEGTFFQLLDCSGLCRGSGTRSGAARGLAQDLEVAEALLTQAGVATIPLSPFYAEPPPAPYVRVCIAKREATLDEAVARLVAFARTRG